MQVQIGKIDFILCEFGGSWNTESHNVPKEIAQKSNEEIVDWAKAHQLIDDNYFYIGVYWKDPNINDYNL
jgi:hypothetical protein